MSRLGWADLGIATMTDMVDQADMLANLNPSVPLIADADTGYGGPVMVRRTVQKYARAGVAALHLEDQVQEKRCGHLLGKELVSREIWYARLRAAVQARNDIGSDMLIIARTDARQKFGFDEAIERLKGAVDCGVDVVFPEALKTTEECKQVCELMGNVPVLLNMVPKGDTPEMSADEAEALGFRIMIFPGLFLESAIQGMSEAAQKLRKTGRQVVEGSGGVKEAFNLCGLQDCIKVDQRAGGKAYDSLKK